MANKVEKLVAFHGGLNDNTDPKDLDVDELASANDCTVSRVGRIGILGGSGVTLTNLSTATIKPVKDFGMFYFSTDRDKNGLLNSEDWLALYNADNGKVKFYYRDKQGSSPDISSSIEDDFVDESASVLTAEPSFYLADGILRYSNGDFSSSTNNRVHQYVDRRFFEKDSVDAHLTTTGNWITTSSTVSSLVSVAGLTVGDIAEGSGIPSRTTVLSIDGNTCVLSNLPTSAQFGGTITFKNPAIVLRQGWVHSDQELKSFEDIGVSLAIDNSQEEGPDDTSIGTELGKIILSYWSSENGQWNGSFQYAASPIYHQGGVGPLVEFGNTVNFYDDRVSYQLHIARGSSFSAIVHPFGDDRIIGVRIHFRSHGSSKWHKLKDFDMLKGGKFNWLEYNGWTDKAKGIFEGDISSITVPNTDDDDTIIESYKESTATFTVTNTASGFAGRQGFLRLWGPYNEPIWKNVNDDGTPIALTSATHVIDITTPGEGSREFQVELLDESFAVVASSDKQKITIEDSGAVPPAPRRSDASSS